MCQAVAGRIGRVEGDGMERIAVVDFGGTQREVSLALIPDAAPGQWVIAHSGYALRVLPAPEVEALEALLAGH